MSGIWENICENLKNIIGEKQFKQWILPVAGMENGDCNLILIAPDKYSARVIMNQYQDLIIEAFWKIRKRKPIINVTIPTDDNIDCNEGGNGLKQTKNNDDLYSDNLIPRYTFENFVVGNSNQVASSAAMLVSKNPSKVYNPLFIYGGVGLGKTHLLHAIGHYAKKYYPQLKVLYISTETYVNEVMSCLRAKRMDFLRYKYRAQCDLFLVDDIQYLVKTDFGQEEFYHSFNYLYSSNKQIVISSDQYPHHIPHITERLKSRFQWGLITDIASPEFETRVKILQMNSEREGVKLPIDIIHLLAEKFSSNVRELEGALNRVLAYSSIKNVPITLEMAKEIIKNISIERSEKISIENITKIVANYFNLKVQDILSEKRNRGITIPRQIAMFLSRKHTTSSLPEIGRNFGGKDHTTVMNAIKKIKEKSENDNVIERAIKDIERKMGL